MNNPIRKTSKKHIIFSLLALTFHLNFLIATVHSQPTVHTPQRPLTETKNITELVVATLNQTISNINLSYTNFLNLQNHLGPNITDRENCKSEEFLELLDDTKSNLETAISKLQTSPLRSHHVNMLLSDAMTIQDTCLEGFTTSGNYYENNNDPKTYELTESFKESILNISKSLSNSLDMLQQIPGSKHAPETYEVDADQFPSWVLENDKRLIQGSVEETKFHLSVAHDGTGNFTTINAAVSAAPNSSETRFVIYIKRGVYFEMVDIPKNKTMLMFVGDGIGRTVIKAKRSTGDSEKWCTHATATVVVRGYGFIAKGITFVNYAGPSNGQAVAFRSVANHSAFYRCSFEGYQDTLYVHRGMQFYRECDVYGTVDFICGNAAAVFQNCSLYARKPNPKQSIAYTAQSRTGPDQATGISMINCRFLAAEDLIPVKASFKSYLGRPWQHFSRTVIITSFIDDHVDPAGWLKWDNNVSTLTTLYYGEYMNEGPGSNMKNRVNWPGYRRMNPMEAKQFTVGRFIDGDAWLNSTGIPFNPGF